MSLPISPQRRQNPQDTLGVLSKKSYLLILVTVPAPTVRPPSRIAKRCPSSRAIGWIRSTVISVVSPGITISVPLGGLSRTNPGKPRQQTVLEMWLRQSSQITRHFEILEDAAQSFGSTNSPYFPTTKLAPDLPKLQLHCRALPLHFSL